MLGHVHVSLHLDQGDRARGQGAVRVHHGVERVLPPLVHDPARGPAQVLHEPVAVLVPVLVDPREGGADVRQELVGELQVPGPPEVLGPQEHEPWRGVDGPVVPGVRDVPGSGQLAPADLVQDLAGFLVSPGVDLRPLISSQHAKRVTSRAGVHGQQLVGADQGVPPEHGDVPGDAGGDDAASVRGGVQGAKITEPSGHQRVEQLVVGDDLGAVPLPVLVGPAQAVHGGAAQTGHLARSRIHKNSRTRHDLGVLRSRHRHLDHIDAEQRSVRILVRCSTRTSGQLFVLTDERSSRHVDINVVLVIRIDDQCVRVRAATGLHRGHLLWTLDVTDIENSHAAETIFLRGW